MQHEIHALTDRPHERKIGEVGFAEIELVEKPGDIFAAAVREVVHAPHLFAAPDQSMREVRADESGNAGDEIDGHDEREYHAEGSFWLLAQTPSGYSKTPQPKPLPRISTDKSTDEHREKHNQLSSD